MANQSVLPPDAQQAVLFPDLQQRLMRARQAQAYAQLLMQDDQQPQGRMVGDVYAAPSWTQQLAQAIKAPLGMYVNRKASDDMSNIYSEMGPRYAEILKRTFGANDESSGTNQPTPVTTPDNSALARALREGAQLGDVGPTPTNLARLQQIQSQPQPSAPAAASAPNSSAQDPTANSLLNQATQFQMLGMPELSAKAYESAIARQAPTDVQKSLLAAGVRPGTQEWIQANQDAVRKNNYIAPTSIRAGGYMVDPKTGRLTNMPQVPSGFQAVPDGNGWFNIVPVPGGLDAVTASTEATKAGEAPYSIIEGYDPVTKAPYKNYAGNVLQLPGSNRPKPSGVITLPSVGPGKHVPKNLGGNDFGGDSLRILQGERARPGNTAADNAALDREIAALTARAGVRPPGIQTGPGLGDQQGATNAQNELSTTWQGQLQANATAQSNVALLQQLRELSDQAVTGYEPGRRAYLSKLAAWAGVKGADEQASATDLLNKFGSQIITGLSSRGMNTDAARDLVMAGTPNAHMQPAAIKEAVDGLISREMVTQARTRYLQPYAGQRDPAGFQQAAAKFDQNADPRIWQYESIKDPAARKVFARRILQADPSLATKIKNLESMGVF